MSTKTKRKPLSAAIKLAAIFYHNDIECPICGNFIKSTDRIQFDHRLALALGGADDETNLEPVHLDCHKRKTFGNKATTLNSDIHAIAKVNRIAKGGKKRRGPKMKGRPFPKKRWVDTWLASKTPK